MGRTPCCDSNGLKKGPWTPDEDKKLIQYIEKHGHGSWRALPAQAGLLRCGKSCRLRWTNYLRPDIKRGKFSFEEEQTILQLHAMLGNKWSTIAARLPGRTDNEIKNFWNTHLKKRLLQTGIDTVTHGPTTQQHHVSFPQSLGNGWRFSGAQCLDYNDMLLVTDDVSAFMPIHNRDEQHIGLLNFQPTAFGCNEGGFHYECQKIRALAGFGNEDTKENYALETPCSLPNLSSYYVCGGVPESKSGMYVESLNPYGESAAVSSDLTYEAVNKNAL